MKSEREVFIKSDVTSKPHKIESENVMLESETERVVAVFYNDYDLDSCIDQMVKPAGKNAALTEKQKFEAWYLTLDGSEPSDLWPVPKDANIQAEYRIEVLNMMFETWMARAKCDDRGEA